MISPSSELLVVHSYTNLLCGVANQRHEFLAGETFFVSVYAPVKDFTPFTLFNLACWFKLYFSFRESYDLILI